MPAPDQADRRQWPFGFNQRFAMMARSAAEHDARNHLLSNRERVVAAAVSRVDPNGHSKWTMDELRDELGQPVKDTGDGITPHDHRWASTWTVYAAIKQAVEVGHLQDGSNPRCLIVPTHRFKNLYGSSAPCSAKHSRKHPTS